ncbi:cystatin-SN-like [Arapaima gigas]
MRYSLDVETFLSFQQHWLTPHQRDFGPCHLCHFELLAGRYYSMLLNASCTKPRLYIRDYSLASSIAQYAVDQYNICPRNSFLYSMWWIISSMEQQHVENGCIYSIVFYMMKSKKGLCCDQRLQKLKSLTVEEMNKLINSVSRSQLQFHSLGKCINLLLPHPHQLPSNLTLLAKCPQRSLVQLLQMNKRDGLPL